MDKSRIEVAKFGKAGVALNLMAGIIILFVCLMIGFLGPEVISSHKTHHKNIMTPFGPNQVWRGIVNDMNRLNQHFTMSAKISWSQSDSTVEPNLKMNLRINISAETPLPSTSDYKKLDISHIVTRDMSCSCQFIYTSRHQCYCGDFVIFTMNPILFKEYRVSVEVLGARYRLSEHMLFIGELVHINSEFTIFQMVWKYLLVLLIGLVMITPLLGFYYKLLLTDPSQWTGQQKWVGVLLVMLLLFNDPFFAAQIFTSHTIPLARLHDFFLSLFLAALLFFWIYLFQDTIREIRRTNSSLTSLSDRVSRHQLTFKSVCNRIFSSHSTSDSDSVAGASNGGSLASSATDSDVDGQESASYCTVSRRHLMKYYLSPAIIITGLWVSVMSTYYDVKARETSDPTYILNVLHVFDSNSNNYNEKAQAGIVFSILFIISYLIYLGSLLITLLSYIRLFSGRILFLLICTLIIILYIIIIGIIIISTSTIKPPVIFLSFYTFLSLYIIILSYAYSPNIIISGSILNSERSQGIYMKASDKSKTTDQEQSVLNQLIRMESAREERGISTERGPLSGPGAVSRAGARAGSQSLSSLDVLDGENLGGILRQSSVETVDGENLGGVLRQTSVDTDDNKAVDDLEVMEEQHSGHGVYSSDMEVESEMRKEHAMKDGRDEMDMKNPTDRDDVFESFVTHFKKSQSNRRQTYGSSRRPHSSSGMDSKRFSL